MNKGVIFRAYPNKVQQELINKTLGCSRLVYNKGLAFRNEKYAKGEKVGYNQTSAMLTAMKKEKKYSFLNEVDSIALQQSLRDLEISLSETSEKEIFVILKPGKKFSDKKSDTMQVMGVVLLRCCCSIFILRGKRPFCLIYLIIFTRFF